MTESKDAGVELAPPTLTDAGTDAGTLDEAGCPTDRTIVITKGIAERLANCRFGSGYQFVLYYSPEDVDAEHRLLSEGHKHGGARMADAKKVVVEDEDAVVDGAAAEEAPAEADRVSALTEQPAGPDMATQDVQKIMEQAGGANGYAVLLSLVAVAGGGAGWKFYQSFAKQRHEQKMKQLEIDQAKVDKQDDSHKQCEAQRMALSAQVESLSAKVGELEAKFSAPKEGGDIDVGVAGEDLEKLDKRLKALENWKKRGAKK